MIGSSVISKTTGLLARLQNWLLWIIAFSCVIASPRVELVNVLQQTNIPLDFRSVTLSIPDFVMVVLILISLFRLIAVTDYRKSFLATFDDVIGRRGGLAWVLLVLWMGAGLLWAVSPLMTRFDTLHAILCLLMALLMADLMRQQRSLFGVVPAVIVGATIQSVVAVLQVLNNGPLGLSVLGEIPRFFYDPTNFFRATGLSMHSNYLGGYLMIALFSCAFAAFINWRAGRSVIVLVIVGSLCGIGLIATLSRSAILGTVVGVLPIGIVLLKTSPLRLRKLLILAVVIILIVAALWGVLVLRGDVATRLLSPREFFFADSWAQIQTAPILGSGAGNLMINIGAQRSYAETNLLPVHNVYLFIWAELGLPGLALFTAGCVPLLFSLLHWKGNAPVLIWGSCFLGVCIIMLFDNYFWGVHPFRVLLFLVLGQWWGLTLQSEIAKKS